MSRLSESGIRHARAKRRNCDAIALEFAMQGFSQAQYVGLGSTIDSVDAFLSL
jgi:hypothetical protein